MFDRVVRGVEKIYVWSNRDPWLTIRRVAWVVTFGWALALFYVLYAAAMLVSIVFAPFSWQALRLALLALDGGITLEPFSDYIVLSFEGPFWNNPASPWTIAANGVWCILFGWQLALAHLAAALVHALTVIGLGTALTNVQLALFALWPFGRGLRRRQLPVTVAELEQQRAAAAADSRTARLLGWIP
ncbi:Integral membrane [Chlorella sorokiniana]|uniref:Integral membrane n=1 Tax=Chlorella sorokiniana TaxID=3076 RepID=A0A2P6TGP7_CHLSO|nr:Integral membrane [Chlorella sorokiniana]|eukprot:PRW33276.1 Integral membrane [Chlorella sorokiniana]